jgi:hypothetical protein
MTKELLAQLRRIGNVDDDGEPSIELLAADELDRLSRIEDKYQNLCAVLNEQAVKIETLQDHVGRLLEMGWKDADIPKVMARYKIKVEDCSFIDYSPPRGALEPQGDAEVTKTVTLEIIDLKAEIQRLQRALAFWLPKVPSSGSGRATRCGNDAMLLVGYPRGMELEPGAEDLGWITFRYADIP